MEQLFLEMTLGRDWEHVCRQMWIHALLQTDVAMLWALTGSCDHTVNTVDYWPKQVSPVWPVWLYRLWSGPGKLASACKRLWTTCGEEQTSLLLLHFPLRSTACTERCMTKPSNSTASLPRTAPFLAQERRSSEGCIPVPLRIQRQSALVTGRLWDLDPPRSIWCSRNLAVFSGIICDVR